MRWRLSKFTEIVDLFDGEEKRDVSIAFNSANEKVSFFDKGYLYTLLQLAEQGRLRQNQLDEINDFVVPNDVNEFDIFVQDNLKSNVFKEILRYTVMVSGNCNFKCCYCGQDHRNVKLSDQHADRIVSLIDSKLATKQFKKLKMSWFGGEPLLAIDQISRMSVSLRNICKQYGTEYISTITTNGYLLRPDVSKKLIKQLGVNSFFLTIDGDKFNHDKRRCLKNGTGTFEIVYNNFVALLEETRICDNIDVILRCNVNLKNKDAIFNLIELMSSDCIQSFSNLSIMIAPIHDWGNDAGKNSLDNKAFAELELQMYAKLIELNFKVKILPKRRYGMCMFSDINAEMVDPYGNVFPCSEVGLVDSYEENGTNKYRIGHITDQSRADRFKMFSEYDIYGDQMAMCRECTIFPSCYGACPKQWHDGVIPCPPTKINLREKLLLFYACYKKSHKNIFQNDYS